MLDDGLAWLSQSSVARKVLLFVAAYVTTTAATILVLLVILAALPVTYFRDGGHALPRRAGEPIGVVVRVAKNAVGIVLIALGLLLSVPAVPGQGVLTMLVGLMLVDFPGKRRLEQKLVARPRVLETMNRMRAWLGRPPLGR
jgi:hypothetical protein